MPRNLKRGRGAVSVSAENVGEDQKKKVFTCFNVQFTPKSSEDQKKVFTSFDVQFTSQNQVKT